MRSTGRVAVSRSGRVLAAVVAVASTLLALPLAADGPAPGKSDSFRQLGRTVAQWDDGKIKIVVGYKWAGAHLDDPWMMLDTRISASGSDPFDIDREELALETPSGERIPIPSQATAAKGMPDMSFRIDRASVGADPLDGYFPSATRVERIGFFAVPGRDLVFGQIGVDVRILASGWLFFHSPTGKWQPGTYYLAVKNKHLDVRLPLTLPTGERKGEGGATIPW